MRSDDRTQIRDETRIPNKEPVNQRILHDTMINIIFNYRNDASRLITDDTAKMFHQIQIYIPVWSRTDIKS